MRIHIVQKGETFESIAKKYKTSVDELVMMNRHLDQENELLPKMKVKVPLQMEKETSQIDSFNKEKEAAKNEGEYQIEVSNKRLAPPHDPNKPKVLPRITEDEYVISDKLITSIEDDQENEFIQQFLPEDYNGWYPNDFSQPPVYDMPYPVQTMPPTPYPYDQRHLNNPDYFYNPYYYQYTHPYADQYYNYSYRPYNPCGCGGYYY